MSERGEASIQQERNISASFRLRTRSLAVLQHKGKLGICLLAVILTAFLIAVTVRCWTFEKCTRLGHGYHLCNQTLRDMDRSICYKYDSAVARKALSRIYRQCIEHWPQAPPRCTRQVQNASIKWVPTNYDHEFFITEPVTVFTMVNNSCVLNAKETSLLFHLLF